MTAQILPASSPQSRALDSGATPSVDTLVLTESDSAGSRRLDRDQKLTLPSVADVSSADYGHNKINRCGEGTET